MRLLHQLLLAAAWEHSYFSCAQVGVKYGSMTASEREAFLTCKDPAVVGMPLPSTISYLVVAAWPNSYC